MNQMSDITRYYEIVYSIVAVALIAYSVYLARSARRARASLAAHTSRDTRV